jgi:putative flippase GtrA
MSGSGRQFARFGRFNSVGVLGAALQMLLFDLLMKGLHVPEVAATPIAVEIVVIHNFFWHERFTWRDRGPMGLRQRAIRLWRFHAGNGLISLAGNTVLTHCLVEQFKAPVLPSALASIAVCAPVNFLVADRWVYDQSHFGS